MPLNRDRVALANQFQKNIGRSSTISMANKIYVQKDYQLNVNFQNVIPQQSGIESVNFVETNASAATINRFVETKTNQRFNCTYQLDPTHAFFVFTIVNAIYIYFKEH